MADFNTTLAAMIAQAKPEFKVNQGHAPIVPGPQGMMQSTSKMRNTNVGVDIGSIMKMFGGMSPEEKLKLAEMAHQTYNYLNLTMDPKSLEAIVDNPDYQSKMAQWHSAGHPSILAEPNSETGSMRYRWVPGAPDKEAFTAAADQILRKQDPQGWVNSKGGGLTQPQIEAGMGGEPTRQTYLGSHNKMAEGTYEAKAKAEATYMHPATQSLVKAQASNQTAQAQLHGEQAKYVKTDKEVEIAKNKAEIERLQADTARIDAETAKLLAASDIDPLAKQGALEADKAFHSFYQAWQTKYANMGNDEGTNFTRNQELGAATLSHIASMKQYTGSGQAGSSSAVRWFASVDREFDRDSLSKKYSKIPLVGPSKTSVASQLAKRQTYFNTALDIVREAGGMDVSWRDKIYKWGRLIGYDDNFIKLRIQEALPKPQVPAAPPPMAAPPASPPSIMLPEGRAEGGPVEKGKPYIVGEKGRPEIMIPNQDGTVVPTDTPTHPSAKAYLTSEESLTKMLHGEIDIIDQAIRFAKSSNPNQTISSETLSRRDELQNMLSKQQERLMRLHGKHMSTYKKDDKKEGENGKS